MGFFDKIMGRDDKKLIVVGLDGVPYTFMKRLIDEGKIPNFAELTDRGGFKRMNSVLPTISSVAWSTFMTGEDAAGHNIFGFIDRRANPFKLYVPTSGYLKAPTIWDKLGEKNKRSIVLNVPVTYPPKEVNGILVSGFLATDINKAVYPDSYVQKLKDLDYIIDVDPWQARESKDEFLDELNRALENRFQTMFEFMEDEPWDYFQCHIMETDRINHFYWGDMKEGDPRYEEAFYSFYEKIDGYLGELKNKIDDNTELIILSDHGFCRVEKEVELNHWLKEEGYLKYDKNEIESVADMSADTKAYSLLPGRIFINLSGREEKGTVDKSEYNKLRKELKEKLLKLEDTKNDRKIIREVYFREDIYDGPYLERAADLIAVPERGYDLKASANPDKLLQEGFIQGMHTYDDAFVFTGEGEIVDGLEEVEEIRDVHHLIMDYYNG
ncbi:MAG: alkaline phosphatase family protein [Halanaerobiales bacterium]